MADVKVVPEWIYMTGRALIILTSVTGRSAKQGNKRQHPIGLCTHVEGMPAGTTMSMQERHPWQPHLLHWSAHSQCA
jgi:hypothetical protein